MAVRFVLNGKPVTVDAVDPHVTLLDWLRRAGHTGTKEGCAEGECGACAVAVVVPERGGLARYQAVNSCLVPIAAVDGRSVVTVEGVAGESGELHPVQRALVERGGSQCGYCTPGFVVSLFCEYYRRGRGSGDVEAISGNLCRCTGYGPLAHVATNLPPPAPGDPRLEMLGQAPPKLGSSVHEHGGVSFARPTGLAELVACLENTPDATLIAGGTDLMVQVNQRYERPRASISLEAVEELKELRWDDKEIVLGGGLTLSEVEEAFARDELPPIPMLQQLLPLFSSRLIRNRATLGGNLGTASPIGDLAPALLALEAELTLVSQSGRRRVPLADFFVDYRTTVLERGEIVWRIHLPRPLAKTQRFYKVSKRQLDDISTVAAGIALDVDHQGRIARLRLAFGGIAKTPIRAQAWEVALSGRAANAVSVSEFLAEAPPIGTPLDDHRGSAAYRASMTKKLVEKFFAEHSAASGASP